MKSSAQCAMGGASIAYEYKTTPLRMSESIPPSIRREEVHDVKC